MLTLTASLQPLVKETWLLASVHGPGLLACHTCTHVCLRMCVNVCVCECVYVCQEERVGRDCHASFLILLGSA